MYTEYFGLQHDPFRSRPAGLGIFMGPQQAEALSRLQKVLATPDAVVTVSGAVGAGKTTVVARVLEVIEPRRNVVHIGRMRLGPDEILDLLLGELGVSRQPVGTILRFTALRRALGEAAAGDSTPLIIVEDARRLGADALAELEAITADEGGNHGTAGMVLMGDTGLPDFLAAGELARLRQRIRLRHVLEPFGAAEVEGYARHCLQLAGGEFDALFEDGCAELLYDYSVGIPREINKLCAAVLTEAAEKIADRVSTRMLQAVACDLYGIEPAPLTPRVAVFDTITDRRWPTRGDAGPGGESRQQSGRHPVAADPVDDDLQSLDPEFHAVNEEFAVPDAADALPPEPGPVAAQAPESTDDSVAVPILDPDTDLAPLSGQADDGEPDRPVAGERDAGAPPARHDIAHAPPAPVAAEEPGLSDDSVAVPILDPDSGPAPLSWEPDDGASEAPVADEPDSGAAPGAEAIPVLTDSVRMRAPGSIADAPADGQPAEGPGDSEPAADVPASDSADHAAGHAALDEFELALALCDTNQPPDDDGLIAGDDEPTIANDRDDPDFELMLDIPDTPQAGAGDADDTRDAEVSGWEAALAGARSLEDIDDVLAETVFGDSNIDRIAAHAVRKDARGTRSPGRDSAAGGQPPDSRPGPPDSATQGRRKTPPPVPQPARGAGRGHAGGGTLDLSMSQRLELVNSLNGKPSNWMQSVQNVVEITLGEDSAPREGRQLPPEPIERQIDAAGTQSPRAPGVAGNARDDAAGRDGRPASRKKEQKSRGMFDLFRR